MIYLLASILMVLQDHHRRGLWDLTARTVLVYEPLLATLEQTPSQTNSVERLAQLEALRADGLITDSEYLLKRREIQAVSSAPGGAPDA